MLSIDGALIPIETNFQSDKPSPLGSFLEDMSSEFNVNDIDAEKNKTKSHNLQQTIK